VRTLTPARLSEKNLTFKLQNRGLCRARTSAKLKVNRTSLQTNTNVDFTVAPAKGTKKNQTTWCSKNLRDIHLVGNLFYFLKEDWLSAWEESLLDFSASKTNNVSFSFKNLVLNGKPPHTFLFSIVLTLDQRG